MARKGRTTSVPATPLCRNWLHDRKEVIRKSAVDGFKVRAMPGVLERQFRQHRLDKDALHHEEKSVGQHVHREKPASGRSRVSGLWFRVYRASVQDLDPLSRGLSLVEGNWQANRDPLGAVVVMPCKSVAPEAALVEVGNPAAFSTLRRKPLQTPTPKTANSKGVPRLSCPLKPKQIANY